MFILVFVAFCFIYAAYLLLRRKNQFTILAGMGPTTEITQLPFGLKVTNSGQCADIESWWIEDVNGIAFCGNSGYTRIEKDETINLLCCVPITPVGVSIPRLVRPCIRLLGIRGTPGKTFRGKTQRITKASLL